MAVPRNPAECTTPEAWAELVAGERESAMQMIAELARARAENAALKGLVERLSRGQAAQEG